MKKVLIIGCPGSGKSTFARKLRDITQLPLYYLDMLWHKPDQTTVSAEEFDASLQDILTRGQWIIDGNYQRTLEVRLMACDTVFLLDYPLSLCLEGASARIGQKREDMPWIETEFDDEFRQWIMDFPTEQLPYIYQMIEKYKTGRDIHIFHSREEADGYLERLDRSYEQLKNNQTITFSLDELRDMESDDWKPTQKIKDFMERMKDE